MKSIINTVPALTVNALIEAQMEALIGAEAMGYLRAEQGLWLKGGAARAALALRLEAPQVRDVDFGFVGDYSDLIDILEWTGLEDVEIVEEEDELLRKRDFTVNEVAWRPGRLLVTEEAIRDTLEGLVRPTRDAWGLGEHRDVRSSQRAKLLALRQGWEVHSSLTDPPNEEYPLLSIVHAVKAWETGVEEEWAAWHGEAWEDHFLRVWAARPWFYQATPEVAALAESLRWEVEAEFWEHRLGA